MGCTNSLQKPVFDEIETLSNKEKELSELSKLSKSTESTENLTKIIDDSILKLKEKKYKIDSNFDFKLVKKFNLEGISGNFYVKSVYDGDTITIYIPMKISIYSNMSYDFIDPINLNDKTICNYEIKLRLFGIDTPELKPLKTLPNREEHIKKAYKAKEFLENLILNKIVQVKFLSNDKYGRPLAYIYIDSTNINELMIQKGYANKYNGGTKEIFIFDT